MLAQSLLMGVIIMLFLLSAHRLQPGSWFAGVKIILGKWVYGQQLCHKVSKPTGNYSNETNTKLVSSFVKLNLIMVGLLMTLNSRCMSMCSCVPEVMFPFDYVKDKNILLLINLSIILSINSL